MHVKEYLEKIKGLSAKKKTQYLAIVLIIAVILLIYFSTLVPSENGEGEAEPPGQSSAAFGQSAEDLEQKLSAADVYKRQHFNLLNNGKGIGDCMRLTEKDRLLIHVPLFHCFGAVLGVMSCITHGTTIVLNDHFNPVHALQVLESEKCTAAVSYTHLDVYKRQHGRFVWKESIEKIQQRYMRKY